MYGAQHISVIPNQELLYPLQLLGYKWKFN